MHKNFKEKQNILCSTENYPFYTVNLSYWITIFTKTGVTKKYSSIKEQCDSLQFSRQAIG